MEILVGPDVSLASTSVCALGANGETVTEAKVPSDPGSLAECMRGLPGSIAAIGLEAGPQSQWLHKGLSEAGHETVLMVRRVKSALKAAPVRTDRRDAEGIAQLLRTGWFQPVHCKSVASQETRALPGSRNALVEGLTRPGLSVRGILRNFGLKPGRVSKGDCEERVRELTSGNATLPDAVEPILRLRARMRDELAVVTKRAGTLAGPDATCRQLMTMPGTGPVGRDGRVGRDLEDRRHRAAQGALPGSHGDADRHEEDELAEVLGAAAGGEAWQEARHDRAGPAHGRGSAPDVAGRDGVRLHPRAGDVA